MAGIGFSLNRLFQKKGMLNLCRAYAYAGAVAIGPMVMGVCLLLGEGLLLRIRLLVGLIPCRRLLGRSLELGRRRIALRGAR